MYLYIFAKCENGSSHRRTTERPPLTQTGASPGQASVPPLQADHPALERSRRPGGRRHLRTHVRVRAGIRAADRAHQRASILVRPRAVSENQRALVGCIPARVAADRRAVRV